MANSVPATVAANAKLVDPGIKAVFADEYKVLEGKFKKVLVPFEMRTTSEDVSGYTGLGDIPLVTETEEFGEDAEMHTYDTTITAYKYGSNKSVSWELLQDDLQGVAKKTNGMTRTMMRKLEKLGSGLFRNGFSTSHTSYGDAKPLFSVGHTRADGGSAQSNASATGITLTDSNLETAILAMRAQLDDRGELIEAIPDTIVVPPALEKEAIAITKSANRSGTADNDVNVNAMKEYNGGQLDVIVWDYLGAAAGGSDTAWYLLSKNNPAYQLSYGWRHKPSVMKLDDSVGAKNQVMYWQYYFRLGLAWFDWRALWGSKGDAQAYSS